MKFLHINKTYLSDIINELRPWHFMAQPNKHQCYGFRKAKEVLLETIEDYGEMVDCEKLACNLNDALCELYLFNVDPDQESDMFYETIYDFLVFIEAFPNNVPKSLKQVNAVNAALDACLPSDGTM